MNETLQFIARHGYWLLLARYREGMLVCQNQRIWFLSAGFGGPRLRAHSTASHRAPDPRILTN